MPPLALDRFAESVPAFSRATLDRVRSIAQRGRALGRNPKTFGLIGDSITVSTEFMTPFARPVELDPRAAETLALPGGGTVIDHYQGGTPNPFQAFRAARIGARVTYPLSDPSDLERLEKEVNPAIVVVAFGANDAAFRTAPPAELADEFGDGLRTLVSRLSERGMIPVISGEMRHGDSPSLPNCAAPGKTSDWKLSVATNATNARALEVACAMDLPYIDLRHALDGATDQGLGKDGVHLSTLQTRHANRFSPASLDCGYEIRNYVTLLTLRRLLVEADLAK